MASRLEPRLNAWDINRGHLWVSLDTLILYAQILERTNVRSLQQGLSGRGSPIWFEFHAG